MNQPAFRSRCLLGNRLLGQAKPLVALVGLLLGMILALPAEPSFSEYQVKALFLLNFTKYVDWPPHSFAETNTPITIGLNGENKFGDALKKAVEGKSISGRPIIIRAIEKDGDAGKCHILFISDSEKKRLGHILRQVRELPVLTVGESDEFMEEGGVINFMKKAGKIRLEINLDASLKAKLEISSKLLSVADVVKGHAN